MSICGYIQRRKPGRPPALSETERRQRILSAAEQCFVSQGYRATQMDDVVKACGMSKKTVYQAFGTKENLFTALIDSVIEEEIDFDLSPENHAPDVMLVDILTHLSGFILSERQVSITRLVISESAHAPELAAAFHENGLMRCRERLTDILSRMRAAGSLRMGNPGELASLLVGAVVGEWLITALIRRPQPMSEAERAGRVARLVDLVRPALLPPSDASNP